MYLFIYSFTCFFIDLFMYMWLCSHGPSPSLPPPPSPHSAPPSPSQKSFPEILNLESWIPASIEVQYSVLKFNTRYGNSTISLNFNTGLDPRFKISGKLLCGALNLESGIQARIEFNHITGIQYSFLQA